jgi:hypothetical protein
MSTQTPQRILAAVGPSCRDNARRQRILGRPGANGIDYVELDANGTVLHLHFLNPAGGLIAALSNKFSTILVHGGTRIVDIAVIGAKEGDDPQVLDVSVDRQGDFSPYLISIGWKRDDSGAWVFAFDGLDRLFSVAPVNFRPDCPVDFDCAPGDDCAPEVLPEPALDYLARDYASFRQLLIDLAAQLNPTWTERSPADIGMALLELFAYEGDNLAYLQDAVANEAYLDTARQRVSAKRHAALVDYRMHDGRNAWTYVHLAATGPIPVPRRTQLLTRIAAPMRFDRKAGSLPEQPPEQPVSPPQTQIDAITAQDYLADPALARVQVFETTADVKVDPANNELRFHTWGNEDCCLPRGATSAHFYAIDATLNKAIRPPLEVGQYLLLEEVLAPKTGMKADADPHHRQIVRIEHVTPSVAGSGPPPEGLRDPLYLAELDPLTGEPKEVVPTAAPVETLPLVEVSWAEALSFPLCLSLTLHDGTAVRRASLARGNIVVADHGRTVVEELSFDPPYGGDRARMRLALGPLTMKSDRPELDLDVRQSGPAIRLEVGRSSGPPTEWKPVRSLLDSGEFDAHFVVDVDSGGRAELRFGDGDYGQRLLDARIITATYRVGNGRAGNIGAEGLAHIVLPPPSTGNAASDTARITAVRNPLPAQDGTDPESIEEVRIHAPAAFRATQFRAVTEEDYKRAALTVPGVAGAAASFRWTGSWYTALVAIDPADPEDLLTDPRGLTRLAPQLRQLVVDTLDRNRLAGYDLEVRCARYVPLDVALQICVIPGYFPGDVAHAVALALRGGAPEHGGHTSERALFDPANFTFGQPVHLSTVYAAVQGVQGVESAEITAFHRYGQLPAGELGQGILPIGAWEIARLDDDPNRMENGTLTITAAGGS